MCIKSQVLVSSDGFDGEHVVNAMVGGKAQFSQEVSFNGETSWSVAFDSAFSFGCGVDLECNLDLIIVKISFFDIV